jgi:hypothetical protein
MAAVGAGMPKGLHGQKRPADIVKLIETWEQAESR